MARPRLVTVTNKALVGFLAAALVIVTAVLLLVLLDRPPSATAPPTEAAGQETPDCERVARLVRSADVLNRAWAQPAPTTGSEISPQLARAKAAYVEGATRLWPDTSDPELRVLLQAIAAGNVTNATVGELRSRCAITP
jgi:hypothetical protein